MVLHLKMIKGIFPHAYRFLCKIEHLHALTNPSVKQITSLDTPSSAVYLRKDV